MIKGTCNKSYPKNFNSETIISEDGYLVYKRREDSIYIIKGYVMLENYFVIPYNKNLLVKLQAHINVEW